jgi:CSLREA domain-containing protein
MQLVLDPSRHRLFRLFLVTLMFGYMLASVSLPIQIVQAQSQPNLRISSSSDNLLDDTARIDIFLDSPGLITAYEGSLLFDSAQLEYRGIEQPLDLASRLKREARLMADVYFPAGLTFGLFSPQSINQTSRISSASVRIASIYLKATEAGRYQVALANWRFIDASGQSVAVENDTAALTIQVGDSAAFYPAPEAAWQIQTADTELPSNDKLDLTGEGRIDIADAMELAVIWSSQRSTLLPCTLGEEARYDVNSDGCLDIRDLQFVAENLSPLTSDAFLTTPATFVVNSTADEEDAKKGDGICQTAAGVCTLRAAIDEANWYTGPNEIIFDIEAAREGPVDIQLTKRLPIINDSTGGLIIDGYSQIGSAVNNHETFSNAVIRIQIRGQGIGTNVQGSASTEKGKLQYPVFTITSSGNVLKGIAIYDMWRAVVISGLSATNNKVVGSFIGTNAAGTYKSSIRVENVHGAYLIDAGASYNQVGDVNRADRNVFSGSPGSGFYTTGVGTDKNVVYNSIFGMSPNGLNKLENKIHGIDINKGSSYNIIGGMGLGQHNWIAGNLRSGIEVSHYPFVKYNQIINNYIGVNEGATTGSDKALYQNGGSGIHLEDKAEYTIVQHNVIGNNQEGGIELSEDSTNHVIAYNFIGVTKEPEDNPVSVPNKRAGIRGYARSHDNLILGNVIANNPVGIHFSSKDSGNVRNRISQNSIYNNTNLGIDLGSVSTGKNPVQFDVHGVNPNEQTLSGAPNNNLPHPALVNVSPNEVSGLACPNCTVEIFKADEGENAYGEGKTYLGGNVAGPDGQFRVTVLPTMTLSIGEYVTATATDSFSNTSEFSLNRITTASAPAPVGTIFGQDDFATNATTKWAQSKIGGVYTFSDGTNPVFTANGDQAVVSVAAGRTHWAYLLSSAARDTDNSLTFSLDALPQATSEAANAFLYLIARRIAIGDEYRGKVRIAQNGEVFVQVVYALANKEGLADPEVKVAGLIYTPGMSLRARLLVSGTNPTSLKMRVWELNTPEPTTWQFESSDTTPQLQRAGSFGLRFHGSSSVNNGPLSYTLDDYLVTLAEDLSPPTIATPTPSATAAPSLTPSTSGAQQPTETAAPRSESTATPSNQDDTGDPRVNPTVTVTSTNQEPTRTGNGSSQNPSPTATIPPQSGTNYTVYLPIVRQP